MSFRRTLLALLFVATWTNASAAPLNALVDTLPDGQAWLDHATNDLLPYWKHSGALGQPYGQFPTFRCADGTAYDAAKPCIELRWAPDWIRAELGRDYVRMQARQTFAYAVGFHLTGDPALLAHAAAGAKDIRQRALDPATGSVATYYEKGKAYPPVGERTAQDLAYAGIALASYYYLSRDAATLADLERLHRHLMSYYDPAQGQMRWTLKGPDAERNELVAQLDPLNAYMILVTPLLEGTQQARWQTDMRTLTKAIATLYCTAKDAHCLGTRATNSDRPGERHNDFGHSGKAYWMSLLAARQLGDKDMENWARQRGSEILKQAYLADRGAWASRWRDKGLDEGKEWWIYAELDQLSTTLALEDLSYAQYLGQTWRFWLKNFVDSKTREVYGWVSADASDNSGALKQHHWKNGYHSMEHALIGYLGAQALQGKPATLYFAVPKDSTTRLQPYVFAGREISRETESRGSESVLKVSFSLPQPELSTTLSFALGKSATP